MKKIFWTTMFWFLALVLFWSYVRLFNTSLGLQVSSWFGRSAPVCVTTTSGSTQLSGLTDQLSIIQAQLDILSQKIETPSTTPASPAGLSLATTAPTKVGLYYFNQKEDAKLPMAQQINVTSIQPVYRNLPATDNIIRDTIALLLRGDITASDKTSGFISDFPYKDFRLLNATLQNDGTLVLEFTEIPGFTSGGSARMLILSNTIIKTAMQFKGVTKVQFVPDTLFQP